MATTTITAPGASSDNSSKYWEKKISDVNNIDEKFSNARDLGYLRLNYSRLTAVGKMSLYDNVDIYKVSVQSNGKMAISIRNDGLEDDGPDFSKYEAELDKLKQQTDPEGYKREQAEKAEKEANQALLAVTAPGMKMEVYMLNPKGKEVLVGDSSAEKGTKERESLDAMLKGDYPAKRGNYYIKVSRDDTVKADKEMSYALQMTMGTTYKHDYAAVEGISQDTKNKTESKLAMTMDASGKLSPFNALQIQASRHQATAQMLQIGYMNMADIYNKNSKY